MKYILIVLGAFLLFSTTADNACEVYIPQEKGTKLTYEDYNPKDKLQGSQTIEIIDIIATANKVAIKSGIEAFDKKGKSLMKKEFEYACEGGEFKINMESLIPTGSMAGMEGMEGVEMTMEQENLIFPSNLSVNQVLPDAKITINMSMNGMSLMSMTVNITDRKVEAAENITVPAGSYDCLKISSKTSTNMGPVNVEIISKDWMTPNIGVVRSESYKKGELESYRILKSVSK